jgi:hypothetical protein
MPTGDILQCELETHHAQVSGYSTCWCGYKTYPVEPDTFMEALREADKELADKTDGKPLLAQTSDEEVSFTEDDDFPMSAVAEDARLVDRRC